VLLPPDPPLLSTDIFPGGPLEPRFTRAAHPTQSKTILSAAQSKKSVGDSYAWRESPSPNISQDSSSPAYVVTDKFLFPIWSWHARLSILPLGVTAASDIRNAEAPYNPAAAHSKRGGSGCRPSIRNQQACYYVTDHFAFSGTALLAHRHRDCAKTPACGRPVVLISPSSYRIHESSHLLVPTPQVLQMGLPSARHSVPDPHTVHARACFP